MNENQFEKRKKQGVRLLLLREELDKGKNINKEEIKRKFDIDSEMRKYLQLVRFFLKAEPSVRMNWMNF